MSSEDLQVVAHVYDQPPLFSLPDEVEVTLNYEGRYTADRLFSRKPDIYRTIVYLLGQGEKIRAIKRACHVHHETVRAVAERERIAIDTGKERTIAMMRDAQTMLVESLIDDIADDKLPPAAKAVALGIITDKIELLSGGVTARIETTSPDKDAPTTWDGWLDRMKRASGVDTGLGAGETPAKAAAPPGRVHHLPAVFADIQSDALPLQTAVRTEVHTAPAPAAGAAEAPAAAPEDGQGGGGDLSTGGGSVFID